MMSALLRRRVISLLISSDQINAQVDHPIMIHLAISLLQNRIASKLVLSQQVLMLLNKIIKPRRCHVLYVFPDPFMSFPSTCQMLFHISESIRPSSNRESNLVKSLGMGPATKSDEFSAINIWPSYLLAYICNHICHKKNCTFLNVSASLTRRSD